jgi:hypothetical protein
VTSRSGLIGLLAAGHVTGWSMTVGALAVLAGLIVRHADRLADALNQWMMAWGRRAARRIALTGKTPQEREHGLAVLDRLPPPRPTHPLPQRRRPKAHRRPVKAPR